MMSKTREPNYQLRRQFGQRVRQLRKNLGLSQEELGFLTHIHRTYIGGIERGEQNAPLDNIGRLAKKLSVTLPELFQL